MLTDEYGREIPSGPGPWTSIEELRQADAEHGRWWFSDDTMSFFNCRIESDLYAGRFFVTSEQGPSGIRLSSVRVAWNDAQITTIGKFQQYKTERQAKLAASAMGEQLYGPRPKAPRGRTGFTGARP